MKIPSSSASRREQAIASGPANGVRAFFAQHPADTRDGTARPVTCDPPVQPLAAEVGHQLSRCGVLVALRVVFGLKLARQEPPVGLGEFLGLLVHAEALGGARRQNHLRAEKTHQTTALDGKRIGHGHHQRVALRRTDHRQPDPRVAAGGLDHRLPGLQVTATLGLFDDADRQAVLDRGRRVEELGLHIDPHMLWRDAIEANAGRVADGVDDGVIEASAAVGAA